MSTQYQGDALFGPCPDGGDIEFVGGAVARSGGLSGASYISMFGGNDQDPGTPDSKLQWWGNYLETDPEIAIRGRTGKLIAGLPMSTGNLLRVEQAAQDDHAWMISRGVADSVEVTAGIESARRCVLTVDISSGDTSETFVFRVNWLSGPSEIELSCGA